MNKINYKYNGFIDKTMKFAEKEQLLKPELWRRFVQQFREDSDYDAGWRGEYWGKMMRGACFVYSYTKNKQLYDILAHTISDMLESADEDGRISTYSKNHEFDGWDIWCRKYVLLGMQYFLEICTDNELKNRIIKSMTGQVDYIIGKIGNEPSKIPITSATRHWRGLNSSSILEPIMHLYFITKEKRYLDFAEYIVNSGGTDIVNIFELAYKDELMPYQYPITKAYEMISCFEGLLEYYKATGTEWYKTAVINFADRILENDFTVIGCCGCSSELFDHSSVRQANTTNGEIMQETCVTVTLMKFMCRLNLITGNSKYADAFETSLYNAYLGSLNTENIIEDSIHDEHCDLIAEPLPFDSYSPLTSGTRGNAIGGLKQMSDNHYYGCCACIGSLGIGLVPEIHLLQTGQEFIMNLYIDGTAETNALNGETVSFETKTEYPKSGNIEITVNLNKSTEFELKLHNPFWSENTAVSVNGQSVPVCKGYIPISRLWSNGDKIEIVLDMRTKVIRPVSYGHQILMNKVVWGHNYVIPTYDKEDPKAKNHIALRRGPIMLAQDNRLGYSVDEPVSVDVDSSGHADVCLTDNDSVPFDNIVAAKVKLKDNKYIIMTDYASAGKLWSEKSKMAVWILQDNA